MTSRIIRSAPIQGSRRLGPNKQQNPKTDPPQGRSPVQVQEPLEDRIELTETLVKDETLGQKLLPELRAEIDRLNEENARLGAKLEHREQELKALQQQIEERKQAAEEQGYKDGVRQAESKLSTQGEELEQVIALVQPWLDSQIQGMKAMAVEVGFACLCKVVGEQFSDQKFVEAVIAQVASKITNRDPIRIHLNSADHEKLSKHIPDLQKRLSSSLQLVSDVNIRAGGCMIDTGTGTLDGRLESQLQILKETLVSSYELLEMES